MRRVSRPNPGRIVALRHISLSQVWVGVAVVAPVLIVTSGPLLAIDLTYHLRAGELMLKEWHLLRTETFTATVAGVDWPNQQWLAQILLSLGFRAGGWLGLAILRALLSGLTLALVYLSCRARGAPRKAAAWLTLAAGVVLRGGFHLRPQLFGLVCFALAAWLLARRDQHPKGIVAVPIVATVWANVHGSFPLAFVLIALAWFDERSRNGTRGRALAAVGVATTAATLLSPLGGRVWTYAFDLATNPLVRSVLTEWQPPTFRSYSGAFFFLSLAAVGVLLSRLERPVPLPTYLTLGVFLSLALLASRGVIWWAVAAPVALAPLVSRSSRNPDSDPRNALNAAMLGLLTAVAFAAMIPWLSHADRDAPGERFLAYAPPEITSAMQEALRPGQIIFNAQKWGSWFEFALPRNPVFVDSRFELITPLVWEQYVAISEGRQGWQAILDRWNVSMAVLSYDQEEDLIPLMHRDPSWRLIYEDDHGLVFIRN